MGSENPLERLRSEIPKMLLCLARLERITARVYKKIADKSEDAYTSLVLAFIGHDSGKHSLVFRDLALRFYRGGATPPRSRCSAVLGSFYEDTCRMLREVERMVENAERLGKEELRDILTRLTGFEDMAGEEYLTGLIASLMASSEGVVEEAARRMLGLIGEDERRHQELLEELLSRMVSPRR